MLPPGILRALLTVSVCTIVVPVKDALLVVAGVYPKALVTLLLARLIMPFDTLMLLPTLTPPSVLLVAFGNVYALGIVGLLLKSL